MFRLKIALNLSELNILPKSHNNNIQWNMPVLYFEICAFNMLNSLISGISYPKYEISTFNPSPFLSLPHANGDIQLVKKIALYKIYILCFFSSNTKYGTWHAFLLLFTLFVYQSRITCRIIYCVHSFNHKQ